VSCATLTATDLRRSGSLSTSLGSWTTAWTITSGSQGFITFYSGGTNLSMLTYFFQYSSLNYVSITCLAQSGNAAQSTSGNSPGLVSAGTQALLVQLSGQAIQVKSTYSATTYWNVLLF
jgi:hypothetical protein